ncbi:hypothetical protein CKAN_02079200 [Cinnamomum micranthum f. kanehirae]|uniref:Uncharacterized protein n=1 Tax=Cinnamomum micranthum f. kanehirae TaxID=337451 RepID=A0A443PLG6_9MAGN|nr:hypothetical protein CKAN_02079200 [Cinnamomum micranthum f. kanehirae]
MVPAMVPEVMVIMLGTPGTRFWKLNSRKGFGSGPKFGGVITPKEYTWVRPCIEFGKLRFSLHLIFLKQRTLCSLAMKILLLLLVAFATTMVISKTNAERKSIEEHPINFSLQEKQEEKQEHLLSRQGFGVDLGRKVGINGRYMVDHLDVDDDDDDDDDDNGADSPRASSSYTHRQITYDDFRKSFQNQIHRFGAELM